MYYKLTNKHMRTYDSFQWKLNRVVKVSGEGELCSDGWIHLYHHPLLAVLLNPIHANFDEATMRLFKARCRGKSLDDYGLKIGWSEVTLTKEIAVPKFSLIQKIAFGILCAKEVYSEHKWVEWADGWLENRDRTKKTAGLVMAATEKAAWDAEKATKEKKQRMMIQITATWPAWAGARTAAEVKMEAAWATWSGARASGAAVIGSRWSEARAAWAAELATWAINKKLDFISIAQKVKNFS